MTIESNQLNELVKFCDANGITWRQSTPKSFTYTLKDQNKKGLIVTFKDPAKLPDFIKKINEMNQTLEKPITTSVIGGGRGGNNNSYSIGNLWKGTDVFMELAWKPHIELPSSNNVDIDKKQICRITPNIMLIELNQMLYDQGYHCPTLTGTLPFMSFGGGLSTNSHTATGYLADIVQGIQLLLPSGEEKYFSREDEDFDLVCNHPSLGLLGIITRIDIEVWPTKKKLKRTIEYSTFGQFHESIKNDIASHQSSLNDRAIIFPAVGLHTDTPVKMTKWEWVDGNMPNHGKDETQVCDSSWKATQFLPWLAKKHPKTLAKLFKFTMMRESKSAATTTINSPSAIMGPEALLMGAITEMGLLFDYDAKKTDEFFKYLLQQLSQKNLNKQFPINLAIFIRFPNKLNTPQGGNRVAIDFASFGLNRAELQVFVTSLIQYLNDQTMNPGVHYGKSSGVKANRSHARLSWDSLKKKYLDFHNRHNASEHNASKRAIEFKISALEIEPSIPSANDKPISNTATRKEHLNYIMNLIQETDNFKLHHGFGRKIGEKKYPSSAAHIILAIQTLLKSYPIDEIPGEDYYNLLKKITSMLNQKRQSNIGFFRFGLRDANTILLYKKIYEYCDNLIPKVSIQRIIPNNNVYDHLHSVTRHRPLAPMNPNKSTRAS
ncbi:MAG: FAD-binding oxidoreductase [Gammaproteobacteria bacterium]|nr:FAD-binding oxidoreductase [Gammaproteobacteria bacterium]